MSSQLIYVPIHVATRAEDGPALAHRSWVVHPEKGVAFRLGTGAEGEAELVPLCATRGLMAKRLAQEVGDEHNIQFVQAVFLRHAEALMEQRSPAPALTRPSAPNQAPARPQIRKPSRCSLRLAKIHAMAS